MPSKTIFIIHNFRVLNTFRIHRQCKKIVFCSVNCTVHKGIRFMYRCYVALDRSVFQNFFGFLFNCHIFRTNKTVNKSFIFFQPSFQSRKRCLFCLLAKGVYNLQNNHHCLTSCCLIAACRSGYRTPFQTIQHHSLIHAVSKAFHNIAFQIVLNLFRIFPGCSSKERRNFSAALHKLNPISA